VESPGAGSVARSSAASIMILSLVPNSRRPEILMTTAARPMPTSSRRTTVREGTIVTVKNAGNGRSHQWLKRQHQAIYPPYEI
jgi:hypothetical protein